MSEFDDEKLLEEFGDIQVAIANQIEDANPICSDIGGCTLPHSIADY